MLWIHVSIYVCLSVCVIYVCLGVCVCVCVCVQMLHLQLSFAPIFYNVPFFRLFLLLKNGVNVKIC